MQWTALLNNPEGINATYLQDPPDLRGVRIHEVSLQVEGPTLKLRFDLPAYPDHPPRKWLAQKYNTVQVELSFGGLKSISLSGFGTDISADVSITGEGGVNVKTGEGGVNVEATSPGFHLQANAMTASVSRLSAYANEL
ncbi:MULTISPECIES: Imm50 family immunity protein [Streptomyces albovinaceus subgroup]|uniref:Imm50 family immunity protein n=1 Tax=Streptomyces albovinaceus subgroup TaxID=1482558 RepID=UPI00099B974E|nr:Imm50 family immunity protein [Streptomyces mediolani]